MTRRLTVVGRTSARSRRATATRSACWPSRTRVDPALEHAINREALGRLDAIVGCGDLEPTYLGFLGDAFGVPVAYVRGNHDRGGHWSETVSQGVDAPHRAAA